MSNYVSVWCPECRKGKLNFKIAYFLNKIRFACDKCDYIKEISLKPEFMMTLKEIISDAIK